MNGIRFALAALVLVPFSSASATTCLATQEGHFRYNSGKYEYCDNTRNWISMDLGATATACTTTGALKFQSGKYQFCDGSVWHDTQGSSNGTCSVAGGIKYQAPFLLFCDGTNWYAMRTAVCMSTAVTYTSDSSFTQGPYCTKMSFKLWGGGGGSGNNTITSTNTIFNGGAGAFITGMIPMGSGTYTVRVGGGGAQGGASGAHSGGANGGGTGYGSGGGGGGRSAILTPSGVDWITAGGGGGGGAYAGVVGLRYGGGGGNPSGQNGAIIPASSKDIHGRGATQTAAGAATTGSNPGSAGSGTSGGAGNTTEGAGGGGGWFGGGGAGENTTSDIGGGGGGSSYVPAGTATDSLLIGAFENYQGGLDDPDNGGAGAGGIAGAGTAGKVIIYWGVGVNSFWPTQAPLAGGTYLTVYGWGFESGNTGIVVGGNSCTNVVVRSATEAYGTLPAHAAGNVDVQVKVGTTTMIAASSLTYVNSSCSVSASTLSYTGSDQTFSSPSLCKEFTVKMWGAGGGSQASGDNAGGGGGYATATVKITRSSYRVVVGQGGHGTSTNYIAYGGGGGSINGSAGGGGGRTSLAIGNLDIVTAGAGGGGGYTSGGSASLNQDGGAGGGLVGIVAGDTITIDSSSGYGGTQSAGGTGGTGSTAGGAGTEYRGGQGATTSSWTGGGGAGFWGGGGGASSNGDQGGGGGGSSWCGGYSVVSCSSANTVAGTGTAPGNQNTADGWATGIGAGATRAAPGNGGNGKAVFTWSN